LALGEALAPEVSAMLRIVALLALLLGFASAPIAAAHQQSAAVVAAANATPPPVFGNSVNSEQPPVVVNDCQFYYRGSILIGVAAGMRIEYTNESQTAANLIEFLVTDGTRSVMIRDVGKFSPGVEIIHKFPKQTGTSIYSPLFSHPHITCRAQEVHFVDGTTWVYGAAAAAASKTETSLGVVLEDESNGVTIEFIAPGGASARGGLQQGDLIVTFGGNAVHSIRDVDAVLSITSRGVTIPITVERSGSPVNVSVTLSSP
jgi:S1-C subfamily serine protease